MTPETGLGGGILCYDPEVDPAVLWGRLDVLGVEMEAAVLTVAAMRGIRAGCLFTVPDTIGEEIVYIREEELRKEGKER